MRKIILFATGLLLSFAGASAQNSSVELLGGFSVQPYTLKGENRTAFGVLNGGNESLRYTYFITAHIGVFAQAGLETVNGGESSFFGVMNKADGGKYMYRFSNSGSVENDMSVFSLGVAYKWDSGIFRFTPRLALGIGEFSGYDYSYERRSRNGVTGPEYFSFAPVLKSKSYDYLIDGAMRYISPSVMLISADFQISVKPDRRIYFFLQPGVTVAPFSISVEHSKCISVHRFDPVNWAEALAYTDIADTWVRDPESKVTSVEASNISPFFHLNVGIGVNFGYKNRR